MVKKIRFKLAISFNFSEQGANADQPGGNKRTAAGAHSPAPTSPTPGCPALSASFTATSRELWRVILVHKGWGWELLEESEGYLFEGHADCSTVSRYLSLNVAALLSFFIKLWRDIICLHSINKN